MTATLEDGSESDLSQSIAHLPSPPSPPWPHDHGCDEDQAARAESCLLQPITHKIIARNTIISIALIDEYTFTREAITKSLREYCNILNIMPFKTSEDYLKISKIYDIILYHRHENTENKNFNLSDILKKMSSMASVIMLCDVDSYDLLHTAFSCGVRGYIPTESTTFEVVIEIIHLVKAGGIFVPPSSLSLRKIKLTTARNAIKTQKFTPRQMEVLERLKLGQTNKIIAYELNMSESSVKAHIQNIMKKMNATNRTEVACIAQKLEINSTHLFD